MKKYPIPLEMPTATKLVRQLKKLGVQFNQVRIYYCQTSLEQPQIAEFVKYNIYGKTENMEYIGRQPEVMDIEVGSSVGELFSASLSNNIFKMETVLNWYHGKSKVISIFLIPSKDGRTNINCWFMESLSKSISSPLL